MKKFIVLLLNLLFVSCGLSEDCFKNAGSTVVKELPIADFDKIRVHSGIALVVKEGVDFKVKIEAGENIIGNIDVQKQGDF